MAERAGFGREPIAGGALAWTNWLAGVVAAYAHLTGQSIPTLIGTGFTVIDKDNVDDPNVKRFIYSD